MIFISKTSLMITLVVKQILNSCNLRQDGTGKQPGERQTSSSCAISELDELVHVTPALMTRCCAPGDEPATHTYTHTRLTINTLLYLTR